MRSTAVMKAIAVFPPSCPRWSSTPRSYTSAPAKGTGAILSLPNDPGDLEHTADVVEGVSVGRCVGVADRGEGVGSVAEVVEHVAGFIDSTGHVTHRDAEATLRGALDCCPRLRPERGRVRPVRAARQ